MSPSSFTWLQFDADQSRWAREIVRALSEPTTLDAIGIGTIRDGLANLMFPGTSTIQTRVRYFLLVPWSIQKTMHRSPRTEDEYRRRLRDTEVAVIESLCQGSPEETPGIIGVEARRNLRHLPSTIYWTGLATWGIRLTDPLSAGDLIAFSRSTRAHSRQEDGTAGGFQVWDEMPPPPTGFPDSPMSVVPTLEEADYLLAKMQATREPGLRASGPTNGHPTVLAQVAAKPESVLAARYPWDVDPAVLAARGRDLVNMARDFSLVIHGARLRYLDLLFDRKEQVTGAAPPGRDALDRLLDEWVADMTAAQPQLAGWLDRLDALFETLRSQGTPLSPFTCTFVEQWSTAAVTDARAALRDDRIAALIRDREAALKKSAARLSHDSPLHAWNGELLGSDRLDFRWPVVRRHIRDCLDGKGQLDA